ncbi:MAG: AAA family ATPase [Haloarculaceae archaeon]
MVDSSLHDFHPPGDIYKATGPPDHWLTTLNEGIWGFRSGNEDEWQKLDDGDLVVFHSTTEDTDENRWSPGVVGYGVVDSTARKDYPLWRTEKEVEENQYPFVVHLSETRWRGALDAISGEDVFGLSLERLHGEIEALLENRLTFDEIEAELDYNFPVMGSFSGIGPAEEVLGLLRSEPLTVVRYREIEVGEGTDAAPERDDGPDVETVLGHAELASPPDAELFDGLFFLREERERIRNAVTAAVRSGKHVVFTGPPGTGKTELAENACRALVDRNATYTGYRLSTATADWSTFDTVGGYMPRQEGDGSLEFTPGQVLKRLLNADHARNELLIVDEINRADIDKAFGQLFTVLSGQAVQLPFERGGSEVEILPSDVYDPVEGVEPHEYVVPETWRLFATMNSYDKTSLYEMSYAFMRRFAFVRVGAPPAGEIERLVPRYVEEWDVDPDPEERRAVADVWRRMNTAGREIGPAIVRDMLGMMTTLDGPVPARTTQAVASYVLPQLEGIPEREDIVRELLRSEFVDADGLRGTAREMLGVSLTDGSG